MMLAGDEFGHSQGGNNNAYCQDNETSWFNWAAIEPEEENFITFVRRLIQIRLRHPALRWPRFLHGQRSVDGVKDITWLAPSGQEMTTAQWQDQRVRCVGLMLNGETGAHVSMRETPIQGEILLGILNGHASEISFTLPVVPHGTAWLRLIDTASEDPATFRCALGRSTPIAASSVSLWCRETPETETKG